MEQTPYRTWLELEEQALVRPLPTVGPTKEWKYQMPMLAGTRVVLREPRRSDAASLLSMLSNEEVSRFIAPPPSTVEGFEQFIDWAQEQRSTGTYVCFAVVPHGYDTAVGIFEVRQLDPVFETGAWGFALGSPFWGTGVFLDSARLVIDFSLITLGVHRLEARTCVKNGRANAALQKLGAVPEGLLRKSFLRDGRYLDQRLWTILEEDWFRRKALCGRTIH